MQELKYLGKCQRMKQKGVDRNGKLLNNIFSKSSPVIELKFLERFVQEYKGMQYEDEQLLHTPTQMDTNLFISLQTFHVVVGPTLLSLVCKYNNLFTSYFKNCFHNKVISLLIFFLSNYWDTLVTFLTGWLIQSLTLV